MQVVNQFPRFARDDNTVSKAIGFHQISRVARNFKLHWMNVEQRETSGVRFKHPEVVIPSEARELNPFQLRRKRAGNLGLRLIFDAFALRVGLPMNQFVNFSFVFLLQQGWV